MTSSGTVAAAAPAGDEKRLRRRRAATVAVVALIALAADQVTKSIAVHNLNNGPVHVIGPFSFNLQYNTGVAFSIGIGLVGINGSFRFGHDCLPW